MANQGRTCPSYTCREGATLIGIVGPDGLVHMISEALPVTSDFVARVQAGDTPTARFRFAGACIESGCLQWDGGCTVAKRALAATATAADAEAPLPLCAIRPTCRWFADHGRDACVVCPEVTRDRC